MINQIYIRRFFCDYKKTSNLNEEDFQEQYAREIKDLGKDKNKELTANLTSWLMRKTKNSRSVSLTNPASSLSTGVGTNAKKAGG